MSKESECLFSNGPLPTVERFGEILEYSSGLKGENPNLQEPKKVINGAEAERLKKRGLCPHTLQTHCMTPNSNSSLQR